MSDTIVIYHAGCADGCTAFPSQRRREARVKLPRITEREWQSQVLELAAILGWRRAHFRASRTAHGWRTAVEGDGAGFVDLVLVRERVIWAELKRDGGKLTAEQEAWIAALKRANQECYVWRPADFDNVRQVLTARRS